MSWDNTNEQESIILTPLTDFVDEGGEFTLLLKYPNGMVKFHSSEAYNPYLDVFKKEFDPDQSKFTSSANQNSRRLLPSPNDELTILSRALEEPTLELQLSSETELHNHLRTCFRELQQLPCKSVAKAWIKSFEPKKQTRYPYNRGESTKPPWWPRHIRHCEPDHLVKGERIDLLVAISKNPDTSIRKLREATNRLPSLDEYKLRVLDEIYMISQTFKIDKDQILVVSDFENGVRSHKRRCLKREIPQPQTQIPPSQVKVELPTEQEGDGNETIHTLGSNHCITQDQLSMHPTEYNNFLSSSPTTPFTTDFLIKKQNVLGHHRYGSIDMDFGASHHHDIDPDIGSSEVNHNYTQIDDDPSTGMVSELYKIKKFNMSFDSKNFKIVKENEVV